MRFFMICSIALAIAACDQKPKEELPTTEPAPAAAERTTTAIQPAATEVELDDIPTREDFEEEARQSITAENMQEELEAIEKELEEPG